MVKLVKDQDDQNFDNKAGTYVTCNEECLKTINRNLF